MNDGLAWLAQTSAKDRDRIASALSDEERNEFGFHWRFFARENQLAPDGDWRIWLIMPGRGFGKTRAGAEWVRALAEGNSNARIALVSSSFAEARAVMVEGESGIIACSPPDRAPVFEASLRRLKWPNGAQAHLFSAAEPEALRGPQHSHACLASAEGVLHQSGPDGPRWNALETGRSEARHPTRRSSRRHVLCCRADAYRRMGRSFG